MCTVLPLKQQLYFQLASSFHSSSLRRSAPSAEFSVDRARHLMSFLTMLGPSPDWNVGLSGEDLCTRDCGWVQRLVKDLVPWDAGTDSGVTYEVSFHRVIRSLHLENTMRTFRMKTIYSTVVQRESLITLCI